MSRKGAAIMLEVESNEATSDSLARKAEELVREAASECSNGTLVPIDYLGFSINALELDLRKFVHTMSWYIVLS